MGKPPGPPNGLILKIFNFSTWILQFYKSLALMETVVGKLSAYSYHTSAKQISTLPVRSYDSDSYRSTNIFEIPDCNWSNLGMLIPRQHSFVSKESIQRNLSSELYIKFTELPRQFFCFKREHTERSIFWAIYQVHRIT